MRVVRVTLPSTLDDISLGIRLAAVVRGGDTLGSDGVAAEDVPE